MARAWGSQGACASPKVVRRQQQPSARTQRYANVRFGWKADISVCRLACALILYAGRKGVQAFDFDRRDRGVEFNRAYIGSS